MGENSKIEWCNHTANLWHGCTKVTAGCDHCYAETLSHRWGNDIWGNDKPRKEIKSVWKDLEKYQKLAEGAGEIHRVFVGSMMDIAEKPMPVIDSNGRKTQYKTNSLRDILFGFISDGYYDNLLFLFLSKRPSNYNKQIPEAWKTSPPKNVMFGTSPCDQATADKLIPQLLQVKGFKFLSVEPMLEAISLHKKYDGNKRLIDGIDWVICGGESGHGKRPFDCDWARFLRWECRSADVAFFMKQVDKIQPIPDSLMTRQFPRL